MANHDGVTSTTQQLDSLRRILRELGSRTKYNSRR
jgi:hypothetical protein